MKYIAVFLVSYMMFLSSVSGMVNSMPNKVAASCCKQNAHKNSCGDQKNVPCNDCAKGICNTMLSCAACGFLIVPSLSISSPLAYLRNQISYPFMIGDLSDYNDNGWNPPKV
jgi:hypothetical protein